MRSVLPLNFPENWQRGTWVNILHHPLIGCEALWLIVISCIKSLECRAWVHCKTVFWLPLTLELCLGLFHILQRKGCGKMRCCCFSDQLGLRWAVFQISWASPLLAPQVDSPLGAVSSPQHSKSALQVPLQKDTKFFPLLMDQTQGERCSPCCSNMTWYSQA